MTPENRICRQPSKTGDCGRHTGAAQGPAEISQARAAAKLMLDLDKAAVEDGSAFSLAGHLGRKGKTPTEHQEHMKAALNEAL